MTVNGIKFHTQMFDKWRLFNSCTSNRVLRQGNVLEAAIRPDNMV